MLFSAQGIPGAGFVLTCPPGFAITVESAIKTLMWWGIVSYDDGIRHPRLFALADTFLSITCLVTGLSSHAPPGRLSLRCTRMCCTVANGLLLQIRKGRSKR